LPITLFALFLKHVTLRRFKRIARKAIRSLPELFQPHLKRIDFRVKRRASRRLRRELELDEDDDLFGLYEGTPLTDMGHDDAPELPPRITLFWEPLLESCEDDAELEREIQITILHEIGHFFGLEEDDLERLGYG